MQRRGRLKALANLARLLAENLRAVAVFGAPEGHDAATIGALADRGGIASWLHVCRDDAEDGTVRGGARVFHPGFMTPLFRRGIAHPMTDRVSPNGEIIAGASTH